MLNPVFSIAHLRQMSEDVSPIKEKSRRNALFSVPMFYEVTHKVRFFLPA
jgi:hypothetical protein